MKNKNIQLKPLHLHLEHFFRKQYCLYSVLALMAVALIKTDARMIEMMRHAYTQGFGIVGQFMREETTRVPVTFDISARVPTISGK